MDPILRVVVTRSSKLGKQLEILQVQQKESFFSLVTESDTIFFSPGFTGRMRCGSKFIESTTSKPVAAYLGRGYPLVIDAPAVVPWWIVHLHDEAPERPSASLETLSFYKLHSGRDFLVANLVEQMMNGASAEPLLQSFLHELPSQLEPCADLPAAGNRRLAERLRQRILEMEDKQINLKDIADQLDCHPSQLSREFRRLFGIAPYKFSFLLRLAKTREWLRKGQNLAEVALNFEFSDQSHFTRSFRQVYQMTPNYYRNLYRDSWDVPAHKAAISSAAIS